MKKGRAIVLDVSDLVTIPAFCLVLYSLYRLNPWDMWCFIGLCLMVIGIRMGGSRK